LTLWLHIIGHVTTLFDIFDFLHRHFVETDTNLKSAALTILEILTLNAQKLTGQMTLTTPQFWHFFQGSCGDCPWEHACQIGIS